MKKKIGFYLLELVIVFVGVFSAFLLNDWQQKKAKEREKKEIYMAVYEDLNRFYEGGRIENENGFINLFIQSREALNGAIQNKALPPTATLFGDYYNIEIINSMLRSGILSDLDIHTFKEISRFQLQHENMLSYIEKFNSYYLQKVTANFDNPDALYLSNPTRLKSPYLPILDYLDILIDSSALLVELAEKQKERIKTDYLSEEFENVGN